MEKLIISSILLVSDVIPLSERILKITQPLTETEPKIRDLHNCVSHIYGRLVKNQKNVNKSPLTEELILSDKRRNQALIAVRDVVHGLSVALSDEVSAKAAKLYVIIDKYCSNAYKLGYKAETSVLISLIREFDQEVCQNLLTDLHINFLYESLKSAQAAFDLLSQRKSEEINAKANDTEAATQILEEMYPALTNLVALIQLYNQLEPDKYGPTFNQMISYITEVNSTARARQTRKQKSPDAPAPEAK